MVEEAGQVLEAHVLTSLVSSGMCQHTMAVSRRRSTVHQFTISSALGIPSNCVQRWQRSVSSYAATRFFSLTVETIIALSMDSERGKELFKFDRSLMERLADAHLPMTQINVQRRMRPDISHFIR